MKKRIAAVLLTLCMIIGVLPLAALAATYTATIDGKEYTVTTNDETKEVESVKDDKNADIDANTYYNFSIVKVNDIDTLQYYKLGQVATAPISLVLNATPDSDGNVTVSGTVPTDASAVTIDATSSTGNGTQVNVTVTNATLTSMVSANVDVTINTDVATVELPADAVSNIANAAGSQNVSLQVAPKTNPADVPAEATSAKTYAVNLMAGTTDIGSSINAEITVSLKVSFSDFVEPCLYWLNNGVFTFFNSTPDETTGFLSWTTSHLSDWVVMSKADAEAAGLPTEAPTPSGTFVTKTAGTTFDKYAITVADGNTVVYQVQNGSAYSVVVLTASAEFATTKGNAVLAWTLSGTPDLEAYFKTPGQFGDGVTITDSYDSLKG